MAKNVELRTEEVESEQEDGDEGVSLATEGVCAERNQLDMWEGIFS